MNQKIENKLEGYEVIAMMNGQVQMEQDMAEARKYITALKAENEQLKKGREWFLEERSEIYVLADMDNTYDWESATTTLKEIQDMVLLPPKNPSEEE